MNDFSKLLRVLLEVDEGQPVPSGTPFQSSSDITPDMDPSKKISDYLTQQQALMDGFYKAVRGAIDKAVQAIAKVKPWTAQSGAETLKGIDPRLQTTRPDAGLGAKFKAPARPQLQAAKDLFGKMEWLTSEAKSMSQQIVLDLNTLKQINDGLNQEIDGAYNNLRTQMQALNAKFRGEGMEAGQTFQGMKGLASRHEATIEGLNKHIDLLTKQLSEQKADFDGKLAEAAKTLKAAHENIQQLMDIKAGAGREVEDLKNMLSDKNRELVEMKTHADNIHQEAMRTKQDLEQKLSAAQADAAAQQAMMKEMQDRAAALEADLKKMVKYSDDLEQVHNDVQQIAEKMHRTLLAQGTLDPTGGAAPENAHYTPHGKFDLREYLEKMRAKSRYTYGDW